MGNKENKITIPENSILENSDTHFMQQALKEAINAYDEGEVPVGCVVVSNNRIIGRGYNLCETLGDPTAHAEMIAITAASETMPSWRIENSTIYITLEPCAMCAGAIVNARIDKVVFAATDEKVGAVGSRWNICEDSNTNHRCEVVRGELANESEDLLKLFFKEKRIANKARKKSSRENL